MTRIRISRRLVLVLILLAIATPIVYYLASPLVLSRQVSEAAPTAVGGTLAVGTFAGADGFHHVMGTVKVVRLSDGSRLLRLEGFRATNGPDLYVYLSQDKQAGNFVNLGGLKGNVGDQNYDIPSNVDLALDRYVLIYCRAFSFLFGSAELS